MLFLGVGARSHGVSGVLLVYQLRQELRRAKSKNHGGGIRFGAVI
jgi:hypothetical protein